MLIFIIFLLYLAFALIIVLCSFRSLILFREIEQKNNSNCDLQLSPLFIKKMVTASVKTVGGEKRGRIVVPENKIG